MKKSYPLVYIFLLSLLFLFSCGSRQTVENKMETDALQNKSENQNEMQATLTRQQFDASEMEIGTIKLSDIRQTLKATGMLDVPVENRAIISAYFGGFITYANLLPGDKVRKGQLVASIQNPDFIRMQEDFLKAREELAYSKSVYDRQLILNEEKISSRDNLLQATNNYFSTLARYESLFKTLKLININPEALQAGNLSSTANIYSPIEGYITASNGVNGMNISPGFVIYEIINTDHMHIELKVFEKDILKVEIGQQIIFRLPEARSEEYLAEVFLIGKSINENDRTVNVHGHLIDDAKRPGITGMFVDAEIVISKNQVRCLPREAFVTEAGRYYIFVKKTESPDGFVFEKTPVEVGQITEDCIEITKVGQSDFENIEVLTKGAFNLVI